LILELQITHFHLLLAYAPSNKVIFGVDMIASLIKKMDFFPKEIADLFSVKISILSF
jgi:hypothetical protein